MFIKTSEILLNSADRGYIAEFDLQCGVGFTVGDNLVVSLKKFGEGNFASRCREKAAFVNICCQELAHIQNVNAIGQWGIS